MDASVQNRDGFRLGRIAWLVVLSCALTLGTGCATGRSSSAGKTAESSFFKNPFANKPRREVIDPEAGLEEYDAAVAKYEKKDYDGAVADFKTIAKKYYDYPVEEDSMFMIAECRFAQKRYAWAQDAYDGLIKKYPSTRYLEKSTRRLYAIGATWLNGDGNEKTDELMQVSATDVKDPQAVQRKPMAKSIPLVPNLFDKTRPTFDTSGNALKALKSVWLHDPLGPLADDAVMLTAIYYIRQENYREADHYMDILRREYPKSEYTQTAFVVGSHIKLANYQGPKYDGRDLIEADDLIHSTLNLFPNVEDREGLQGELVKIRDRGAERYWARAEYYKGRMKPQAEAIYCETIINQFPDSEYSNKARARLQALGPKYWTGMLDEYPNSKPSSSTSGNRKFQLPAVPKPKPAIKKSQPATAPKSGDSDEPQFPKRQTRPWQPESPSDSDGETPPARTKVDTPEFVEGEFQGGIEQTSGQDSVGRARP